MTKTKFREEMEKYLANMGETVDRLESKHEGETLRTYFDEMRAHDPILVDMCESFNRQQFDGIKKILSYVKGKLEG
jgi:hypothetical protein